MSNKDYRKKIKALEQIDELASKKRKALIKIPIAVFAMLVAIIGKSYIEVAGLIEAGNEYVSGLMMLVAFGLAAFAGFSSMDYSKYGREIKEIRHQADISKEDIEAYKRIKTDVFSK